MAELPNKPTKVEANQVLQYVLEDGTTPAPMSLKTTATFTGTVEAELDSTSDSVTIGDQAGNKATVGPTGLATYDFISDQKLEEIIQKLQLKPGLDYSSVSNTLSGGGTIETYVFSLGATVIRTLVVTYDDNTRQRWNNIAIS